MEAANGAEYCQNRKLVQSPEVRPAISPFSVHMRPALFPPCSRLFAPSVKLWAIINLTIFLPLLDFQPVPRLQKLKSHGFECPCSNRPLSQSNVRATRIRRCAVQLRVSACARFWRLMESSVCPRFFGRISESAADRILTSQLCPPLKEAI